MAECRALAGKKKNRPCRMQPLDGGDLCEIHAGMMERGEPVTLRDGGGAGPGVAPGGNGAADARPPVPSPAPPSPPEPGPGPVASPPPPRPEPVGLFDIPVGGDLFASPILTDPEPQRWEDPAAPPSPSPAGKGDEGKGAQSEREAQPDGWGPDPVAVLGMMEASAESGGAMVWEPEEVKGILRDLYNPTVLEPLGKRPLTKGEIEAAGRYVTPAVNRWLGKLDPTDPTTAFWGWLLLTHGPRFGGDLLRLARRAGERRRGVPQTAATAAPEERGPAAAPAPPPPPQKSGY